MQDKNGQPLDIAKGSGYTVFIKFDGIAPEEMMHGLLIRHLPS